MKQSKSMMMIKIEFENGRKVKNEKSKVKRDKNDPEQSEKKNTKS